MKFGRNKTLAIVVVAIVIIGLVMAYVPLLFYRAPSQNAPPTASLTPPEPSISTSTVEQPKTETPSGLEGFSDLGNEQEVLDELNKLLDSNSQ